MCSERTNPDARNFGLQSSDPRPVEPVLLLDQDIKDMRDVEKIHLLAHLCVAP